MEKDEIARRLSELLRKIDKKGSELESVTGFYLYEFLTELEELLDLLTDILEVPPWDLDKEIVHNYVWNRADYNYDEMLEKVAEARRNFDPDAYEEFCDEHERCYGRRP